MEIIKDVVSVLLRRQMLVVIKKVGCGRMVEIRQTEEVEIVGHRECTHLQ